MNAFTWHSAVEEEEVLAHQPATAAIPALAVMEVHCILPSPLGSRTDLAREILISSVRSWQRRALFDYGH